MPSGVLLNSLATRPVFTLVVISFSRGFGAV